MSACGHDQLQDAWAGLGSGRDQLQNEARSLSLGASTINEVDHTDDLGGDFETACAEFTTELEEAIAPIG